MAEAAVELDRLRNAFAAGEARFLRGFDVRGVHASDGAKSAAAWLARRTRAPKAECGSRLRLGKTMEHLPVAAEAFAAGEIGPAHLRCLAGARNPRTAERLREHERFLVDNARNLTFPSFRRSVEYWLQRADPDGPDDAERQRRERRDVTLAETFGGMHAGRMLLDPVSGAVVGGELGRLEEQLFQADWKEAKERLGRDPLAHELGRTSQHRRADALVEMATRSATMPKDGQRPRPLFTWVTGSCALAHLSQLEGGQAISPAALLPWLESAQLERIVFDLMGRRAIKVSRKRRFTGVLRRILEVRDQGCTHEYCDEPPARCEGNHIHLYTDGGFTSQDNGDLRCGFHNRLHYKQTKQRPPPDDG